MFLRLTHRSLRLTQWEFAFSEARETTSAILDRLYRAEQVIEKLESSPEHLTDLDCAAWEALYEVLFCRRRVPGRFRVEDQSILAVLRIVHRWAHALETPQLSFWVGTVAWHWTHGDQAVSEAAEACLPPLQARWEKSNRGRSLLRASSAPLSGSRDLVRPVTHTAETDPESLLRPGVELSEQGMPE